MAKLKLYEYPHPILKKKTKRVEKIDDELQAFLDDMLETMYAEKGVGLAAPQVGVSLRIVVIDVWKHLEDDEEKQDPLFLINPEIIWNSEELVLCDEGCLSIPGQRADVERFEQVKVRYTDREGKSCEILGDEFLAIALQHELDHLDGILYIDHLSRVKRNMLLKKLDKFKKDRDEEE